MSFDFSTLITDRTRADVSRVQELASKIRSGTASESELAEFNSAAMKGAYNHTDLNRVTAAMEALKAKLEGYGYAVPGYQRIKVPHVLPEPEPTSRLPEGYLELTYIESTGTQYIDTGFNPNNNTRVVMDAQITSTVSANSLPTYFGCNTSIYFRCMKGSSAIALNYEYGSTYSHAWDMSNGGFNLRRTIDANGKDCTIDGVTKSYSAQTFSFSIPLFLLAANDNGKANYFATAKLYSCQMYDNGTLVRDYIPCINPNGEVGLYDMVTATFFGNSGTGSFVAGAIPRELPEGYTQVEYIQSSGMQYIDTGFKPNQNTRLTMEVSFDTIIQCVPYGARHGALSNTFNMFLFGGSVRFDYGAAQKEIARSLTSGTKYQIDHNMASCAFGDSSATFSAETFTCSYNLALLAINTAGTISNYAKAKLYSCQIYDNGTLVRDYVPCTNNVGVSGLYDMANGVFYHNAGTGSFAAGEEVVAPATASAMVVSDDVAEYDLYTWYEFDWPTPETMTIYLLNVSAIRAVLAVMKSTPTVPVDMEQLLLQEANNIEIILSDVLRQLTIMPTTFIPAGEALCGGDNL